jgi:hypothetical protein
MSLYDQIRLGILPPLGLPGLQGGVMNSMGLPPFPSLMSLQGAQPTAPVAAQPAAPVAAQPAAMVAQPEMGTGIPEEGFKTAADLLRFVRQSTEGDEGVSALRAALEKNYEIPEDVANIFSRQEQRLARREQEAEELAKPNAWRELVRIGTAMMGTQSPQFGQGLAQGLMATVEEQQKRREALRRERAAIDEAREGIDIKRIEQKEAARQRALANINALQAAKAAAGQTLSSSLSAAQSVLTLQNAPQEAIDEATKRGLEIKEKQFKVDTQASDRELDRQAKEAQIFASRASAIKSLRGDGEGGGPRLLSREEVQNEGLNPFVRWQYNKSGQIVPVGGATALKNAPDPGSLSRINSLVERLGKAEKVLESGRGSGAFEGLVPDFARPYVARDSAVVKAAVDAANADNLKQILGGQFARVEGEQLLKRGFDPAMPPEENLIRLKSLRQSLQNIVENANYQSGIAPAPSIGDGGAGAGGSTGSSVPRVGEVRKGYRFKGGNPRDKNSWEKVN